ncbi:MAG: hypothetical protein D6797_09040, partial [Bdellovibrio sp.]
YILYTTAYDLDHKECAQKVYKKAPQKGLTVFALDGYSSATLIKDLGDSFMVADYGYGYSKTPFIVETFSKKEEQRIVKEIQEADYLQFSQRIKTELQLKAFFPSFKTLTSKQKGSHSSSKTAR